MKPYDKTKTNKTASEVGMTMVPMEPMKPSLSLSESDLPAIKSWQVGKTYNVSMKIKQKSLRQHSDGTHSAEFEVQHIKA